MSLAQKSLSVLSRDFLFTVIGLGTGVVVARTLGPVGVGIWAALDIINNYGRVFGGPRLEIASVYFLNQKPERRGEILFLINVCSVGFGILLSILLMANIPFLKGVFFKNFNISPLLILLFVGHFPFLFLKRNYHYFLLSREDTTSYNRMMVVQEIVYPAVAIFLLVFLRMDLWSFVAGMYAGSIASLTYGIARVHRTEKIVPSSDWRLLLEMFRYSLKIYVSEALGFLNHYLSNLICAMLLSPTGLAFFSMGKGKAEWINRITNAASTVLYPRISNLRGASQDPSQTTTLAFRLCLITLSTMSVIFSLLIYPATIILYGGEFVPLVWAFLIVTPGVVLHGTAGLLRQHFLGIGRADLPMKISAFSLVLQAILSLVLIRIWGFVGGAVAVSVSLFTTGAITTILYLRITGTGTSHLLVPLSSDLLFLFDLLRQRVRGSFEFFRRNWTRNPLAATRPVTKTGC